MLKSLDILIGLAAIMLALSMAVTVVTQFITSVANSRGRHLKRGIVDLLKQLDPNLDASAAKAIATNVLTHPLVSGTQRRLAAVVHREELTGLLLQLAHGDPRHPLDESHQTALATILAVNGIPDPGATLNRVREVALQLEVDNPALATSARQSLAVLREAKSTFVAKLHNWFDQTMDRTSERFTFSTRGITFVAAAAVATLFQVDTFAVVNRLGTDAAVRSQLVLAAAQQDPPPATRKTLDLDQNYMKLLNSYGLIASPSIGPEWVRNWATINPAGLVVTALLLSLGAPFWYKALGRLVQLRSVLADKDDRQRLERQQTGTASTAEVPPSRAGERGDLIAVG